MFKREERFMITYMKNGEEKRCYPRSAAAKEDNLTILKKKGFQIVSCKKLYPFNTMKNQHNFMLIANIAYNTMVDMENDEIPWDADKFDKLCKVREKAETYFTYDLPIAWVPWEEYNEMKELAVAAECHRDAANARVRMQES